MLVIFLTKGLTAIGKAIIFAPKIRFRETYEHNKPACIHQEPLNEFIFYGTYVNILN
jgi:hypothetical protein